jgi:hypothetical protein
MTLQDLIADAIDEGLECAAGIHLDREAVISTDDQQSAAWIAFLTRAGFAFSNPISCYAIPGGTACAGILRRAEKRGKDLPPALFAALTAVATSITPELDNSSPQQAA